MYQTMQERQSMIHMPAAQRLRLLLQATPAESNQFDKLALQALLTEIALHNLAHREPATLIPAMMAAHKVREAFHAISWNVRHYSFVKPHHEHCIGFGTILRDGRPFELSGSMCCPGDHCDLSEDEVRSFVEGRLAEAGKLLNEHDHASKVEFLPDGGTDFSAAFEAVMHNLDTGVESTPAKWNRFAFEIADLGDEDFANALPVAIEHLLARDHTNLTAYLESGGAVSVERVQSLDELPAAMRRLLRS
jgi:hypothetical protein